MGFQFNVFTGTLDIAGIGIGGVVAGGTEGSVLFLGADGVLAQDNPAFTYTDATNKLAIIKTISLVETNTSSASAAATSSTYNVGDVVTFRFYPYKTIDAVVTYSTQYTESGPHTIANVGDGFTLTIDIPTGYTGIRILRDVNSDGYATGQDTTNASETDDNGVMGIAWDVYHYQTTPNSYTSPIYMSYSYGGTGSNNPWSFYSALPAHFRELNLGTDTATQDESDLYISDSGVLKPLSKIKGSINYSVNSNYSSVWELDAGTAYAGIDNSGSAPYGGRFIGLAAVDASAQGAVVSEFVGSNQNQAGDNRLATFQLQRGSTSTRGQAYLYTRGASGFNLGLSQAEDGTVGIGILPTKAKLDVWTGAARSGTHGSGLAAYFTSDAGEDSGGIEFRHNNGTQGVGIGYNTIYAAGSSTNQDIKLKSKGTGNFVITAGAIGLGVTPVQKLHLASSTADCFIRFTTGGSGYSDIGYNSTNGISLYGNSVEKISMGFGNSSNYTRPLVLSPEQLHSWYKLSIGKTTGTAELEIATRPWDKVFYYNGSTYTDNTTEAGTSDGTPFTIINSTSDYLYVGSDDAYMREVYIVVQQAGVGITLSAEYYHASASWQPATITSDGTSNFTTSGKIVVADGGLINMRTVSVNGQTKYWKRFKSTTTVSTSATAYVVARSGAPKIAVYRQSGDTIPELYIPQLGNVGIRTTAPDKALEINSATGANLRLTYNDSDGSATTKTDFTLDSTGEMTILSPTAKTPVFSPTVWDDFPPNPIIATHVGSSAPTLATFVTDIEQYTFDATNDYVIGSTEIPHNWKEGTVIYPHIHWATNGSDGTERGVKWQLKWTVGDALEVFSAQVTSTVDATIPASTTDRTHFISEFTTTLDGANLKIGAVICWRLERIATAHANGAPTSDPFALSIGFHGEMDTVGSRARTTK